MLWRKTSELGLPLWGGGENTENLLQAQAVVSPGPRSHLVALLTPGTTAPFPASAGATPHLPALWSPKKLELLIDRVAQRKEDGSSVMLLAPSTLCPLAGHHSTSPKEAKRWSRETAHWSNARHASVNT